MPNEEAKQTVKYFATVECSELEIEPSDGLDGESRRTFNRDYVRLARGGNFTRNVTKRGQLYQYQFLDLFQIIQTIC
jgi:UDP-galactopyranose mutase